jgi:hypothetical protein
LAPFFAVLGGNAVLITVLKFKGVIQHGILPQGRTIEVYAAMQGRRLEVTRAVV